MKYERGINLKVRDLKDCLKDLPDDMNVIIPVCSIGDENVILGFRHARTVGLLENRYEKEPALCVATARDGADLYSLMNFNKRTSTCTKLLF